MAEDLGGFVRLNHRHGRTASGFGGFAQQIIVTRQAENIVNFIGLAPADQVLADETAVATKQDFDLGPMFPDLLDDASDNIAYTFGPIDIAGSQLRQQQM